MPRSDRDDEKLDKKKNPAAVRSRRQRQIRKGESRAEESFRDFVDPDCSDAELEQEYVDSLLEDDQEALDDFFQGKESIYEDGEEG